MTRLDLVAGYRGRRRAGLARYAASGRLRGLDGIYVESSTFLPAEADVAFLALARSLDIPVLTYIRDAYQLFPEYRLTGSLRARLGAWAFRPAVTALRAVSSRLAFPSAGLGRAVLGQTRPFVLVPPGSPAPVDVPRRPSAHGLLFVGNGRAPAQGAPTLIEAVGLARERGADVSLTIVSRPGEEPTGTAPPWLRVLNAEGPQIERLLPDVMATVIPRPRGAYNDLAVPVKLFEYLALGRPLLVTDCLEQAAVVRRADAGIVAGDTPAELADGMIRLVGADPSRIDRWSANAHRAARAASWRSRAELVMQSLELAA